MAPHAPPREAQQLSVTGKLRVASGAGGASGAGAGESGKDGEDGASAEAGAQGGSGGGARRVELTGTEGVQQVCAQVFPAGGCRVL